MNQFHGIQVSGPEIGTHRPNPPIRIVDGADLSRMYGTSCTMRQTTKATDILSSFKRATLRSPEGEMSNVVALSRQT